MANLGYRDVAERLRGAIESGTYRRGDLIPSETALCAEFRVSRTTVRRALGVLEGDKLLTVIPGRGRVVRSSAEPTAQEGESRANFVARLLREQHQRGEHSDEAVKTAKRVAEQFGVAEATAREALKTLADEDLVTPVPGHGWRWKSGRGALSKTEEVAAKLRHAVESGEFTEGSQLPGELTLAERYGVGRVTVRRAIDLLAAEGTLATKAGIGTLVLSRTGSILHREDSSQNR